MCEVLNKINDNYLEMRGLQVLFADQVHQGVSCMLDVIITEQPTHDFEPFSFSDLMNNFIFVNGVILDKVFKVDFVFYSSKNKL